MYDYMLGGDIHYPVDRQVADQIIDAFPAGVVRAAARHNREFIHRAVRHLTDDVGIRQLIDIGAGLLTATPIHKTAQSIAADTRVVYIDNDATVVAYTQDALADANNVTALRHDLRAPEDILDDLDHRELIDPDEPVAVLLGAVLHYISDTDDPADIVNRLVGRLAPGSHLVISHATGDTYPAAAQAAEQLYRQTSTPLHTRTRTEVAELLKGLNLLEPGLVWAPLWRPASDTKDDPENSSIYAAVAYKP